MGGRTTDDSRGDSEFEWVELDGASPGGSTSGVRARLAGLSLRHVVVVAVVSMAILSGVAVLAPSASAQTSFEATDASVASNNGKVRDVTIGPNGTVSYSGLETRAANVSVTVAASLDGRSWETIATKDVDAGGLSGSVTYDFSSRSLVKGGGPFDTSAFRTPTDGGTSDTDVYVRVNATVHESGGAEVPTTATTSFVVTVENVPRGSGVGGQVNSDAR